MGLKQSIVIVNEFSLKTKTGGTRGKSPARYITEYMCRNGATEETTPVRYRGVESFIDGYMCRREATERAANVTMLKQDMKNMQGMAGVAFSNDDVSLSHKKLKRLSREIQNQFDSGKTILKTVISFDEEYLRQHHILEDDFQFKRKGDYRGHIDQMKLRMAIQYGMEKFSKNYDDLRYVGAIQVDTEHVHCHLCMADFGTGTIMPDGRQRGKISESSKRALRRGIDTYLDENQYVRMMSSSVTYRKRNALCFIKKFTHETMDEHGIPQFLISCLPEDKSLWRAGSNRVEMKKANAIVKEFVEDVLKEPDSGYREAMRSVDAYASYRQQHEGLSDTDYKAFIDNGRKRIVEDCMNGVYAVLKRIPDSERTVKTPMLDVMSRNYEELALEQARDPMIEFGFKLRSYSSRLDFHKKERNKYHQAAISYEQTPNVSESSKPLYDFFKFEEEYNSKVMCKYQYFLAFLPPKGGYEEEFEDLMRYKTKVRKTKQLSEDPSPKRMSADSAEDYGMRVYGVHGGRYMTFAPDVLARRAEIMQASYEDQEKDFKYKLAAYGLSMDEKGISSKKQYEFSEVKALDLHHLSYDFPEDFPISKINVDEFVATADERYELYDKAKQYLLASGQESALQAFPESDIKSMKNLADSMRTTYVMPVAKPVSTGRTRSSRTIRLDVDYTQDMKQAVRDSAHNIQMGDS